MEQAVNDLLKAISDNFGTITIVTGLIIIGRKLEKLDDLCEKFTGFQTEMKEAWSFIHTHDKDIGIMKSLRLGDPGSPMHVNELGEKVITEAGFYDIYPQLKGKIFSIMDKKSPRTLYDYELEAQRALKELQNDQLMDRIKDYVVNHPTEIDLESIFAVFSWIIRDDYAEYKKINSSS